MGKKPLLLRRLTHWRLLAFNLRLAVIYIPALLVLLSVYSLLFLSPNPELQHLAFRSTAELNNYYLNEGALIGFAVFTAALAYYKKNRFFIIASAWIFCNLKLGSMALGLDNFWLQQQLPAYSVGYINQLIIGFYFILSQQLIQRGLSISPSSNKYNILLGAVALLVLFVALIPYAPLFDALLLVATPVALLLALAASITHLKPIANAPPAAWQVMLLATLGCGLLSYTLSLFQLDSFLLSRFTAFNFLLLTSSLVVLGILSRFKELRLTQLELRSNYQNSPFAVLKINSQGRILRSNRAFRRLCAKLNLPTPHYWDKIFADQDWDKVIHRTQNGKYTELKVTANGLMKAKSPLLALHANRIHEGYHLVLQDITLYVNTLHKLKLRADHDPITNALNQRGIDKLLQNAFDHLDRHQPCYVAYLDVNHLNYVNRVHGHAAGDSLLQEVSLRINQVIDSDYGRIDSDDFVFLLKNTSAKKAKQLALQLTQHLNNHIICTPIRDYKLNVRLGLIEVDAEMTAQTAVRTAQGACMDAGRRDLPFLIYEYNSQELKDRTEELALFDCLENGITQSLFVNMQPIMNLQAPSDSFILEVLLRIRRANGSLIPLHTFIPAAEENGTICIIDKWVFIATLEWMNSNQAYLDKVKQVNVNLSGHSLNNDQFIQELFSVLDKYAHLLHRLCVEITESVALEDLNRTRGLMLALQKKGISIALDDFGAGYTSFSYLRELPANAIKIDGALIQDMRSKDSNVAIVRTIVELAKNLGMQCIAEWVEDVETLELLQEMGVDYAQGFVVSSARSPEEILDAHNINDLIQSPALVEYLKA